MNVSGWIESFQIFAKYGDWQEVAAEHDIVYAGPNPAEMKSDDIARLTELGWLESEYGCWERFV